MAAVVLVALHLLFNVVNPYEFDPNDRNQQILKTVI